MELRPKKKRLSDEVKAGIIQWWVVGAVYFYVAWGTGLAQTGAIDLIFFLGVSIALVHIFVYYPVVYNMFTLTRRGKVINKKYFERSIKQNVIIALGEVFRCLLVTLLVFFTYSALNQGINQILGEPAETVMIPGEPILFSIFFMAYYTLIKGGVNAIRDRIQKPVSE